MRTLTYCLALASTVLATSGPVLADTAKGPVATMPKVGDTLNQGGGAAWPKMKWLYDAPSAKDAAGKVVIHWFCQPKVQACVDDLARVITLRDTGKVYIVAYINAPSSYEAKKVDPIRESEGVGRGTVAFGKGVTTLDKQLGITGPASFVVDVAGKVQLVSTATDATALDARDAKVTELVKSIKDYTSHPDGPVTVKAGDHFTLSLKIELASWLNYAAARAKEFELTVPKDIKCNATKLTGDQLKVEGHTLIAQVSCSGPHGTYEARGSIKFGYDAPSGAGFGNVDGVVWKFQILP
ncbi:MAG: hypothetical protein ABI467_15735 [Kofleriaceae bacterium]